ncbi:MAG: hypothetical protein WKF84_07130 [Pyrinomonadaceae bacterium]
MSDNKLAADEARRDNQHEAVKARIEDDRKCYEIADRADHSATAADVLTESKTSPVSFEEKLLTR